MRGDRQNWITVGGKDKTPNPVLSMKSALSSYLTKMYFIQDNAHI